MSVSMYSFHEQICRITSANEEGVIEFKGDSSLTRDENGCWSNYVAVNQIDK